MTTTTTKPMDEIEAGIEVAISGASYKDSGWLKSKGFRWDGQRQALIGTLYNDEIRRAAYMDDAEFEVVE